MEDFQILERIDFCLVRGNESTRSSQVILAKLEASRQQQQLLLLPEKQVRVANKRPADGQTANKKKKLSVHDAATGAIHSECVTPETNSNVIPTTDTELNDHDLELARLIATFPHMNPPIFVWTNSVMTIIIHHQQIVLGTSTSIPLLPCKMTFSIFSKNYQEVKKVDDLPSTTCVDGDDPNYFESTNHKTRSSSWLVAKDSIVLSANYSRMMYFLERPVCNITWGQIEALQKERMSSTV